MVAPCVEKETTLPFNLLKNPDLCSLAWPCAFRRHSTGDCSYSLANGSVRYSDMHRNIGQYHRSDLCIFSITTTIQICDHVCMADDHGCWWFDCRSGRWNSTRSRSSKSAWARRQTTQLDDEFVQALEFLLFAVLMAFAAFIFGVLAIQYREIKPDNSDSEDQQLILDRNAPEPDDAIPLTN